ncbi:hypothetical protein EO769_18830 [Escherichia coli]|nr:hypothetical protein EO769_18830 [Escherichia coli]
MFAGKKSAQIREILISESAWEEMTCLFAPSFTLNKTKLIEHSQQPKCRFWAAIVLFFFIICCLVIINRY